MRKNIIIIFLSLAFLAGTIYVGIFNSQENNNSLFSVNLNIDGKNESIECWNNQSDDCYLFFPSCANLSQSRISLNTDTILSINDKVLKEGMKCDDFDFGTTYTLTYDLNGRRHEKNIVFLKSNNVAAMHIDTASGSMDYIHSNKENKESATLNCYSYDGKLNFAGNLKSITGHGNSTWDYFDKKPYCIEFENDTDLFGMGAAKEWILLANADDSSNLRNKLIYEFANKFGLKYSPNSEFVDLYLNGEYRGLYLLCERNDVSFSRININEEGFLVSLEMKERMLKQNKNFIQTNANQILYIRYPKNLSKETSDCIGSVWQSVENAIFSADGVDEVTDKSLEELIDVDSWVRKYLIEEIFGNCDGGFISQYFYCDSSNGESKIFAGPVWDYDHSIGNVAVPELSDSQAMLANRPIVKGSYESPWFYNLYKKQDFYSRVVNLYESEFMPLLDDMVNDTLNQYAEQISESVYIDKIRWNNNAENFGSQVEYIRTYIKERSDFFKKIWCEDRKYHILKEDRGFNKFYVYHAVLDGEVLKELQTLQDTEGYKFLGWYYKNTDKPFDITIPICEDAEIYAKWQVKSTKTASRILKVVPICVFAVIFICLCVVEVKKYRKSG